MPESANTDEKRGWPGERRPPWSRFRAELEAEGFRPTKTRGQNFLIDENCVRSIVRDAQVARGDRVLEVGAGCGFLSVPLAAEGVELLTVEIDARLARITRRFLADYPNARLIEADVLASKHRLAAEVEEALWEERPWHVVANLPYAIVGPLLALLARRDPPPETLTVLVQRELGDRLVSQPGDKAWGALPAKLGLAYAARRLRAVGPQLFWPRPRVDSVVVRLETRAGTELGGSRERFDGLVERAFGQRRKRLQKSLLGFVPPGEAQPIDPEALRAAFSRAGVDPGVRPEELGSEAFWRLSQALDGD